MPENLLYFKEMNNQDEEFIALFHGDFVDFEEIPWTLIINEIKINDLTFFANLSGIFSCCF